MKWPSFTAVRSAHPWDSGAISELICSGVQCWLLWSRDWGMVSKFYSRCPCSLTGRLYDHTTWVWEYVHWLLRVWSTCLLNLGCLSILTYDSSFVYVVSLGAHKFWLKSKLLMFLWKWIYNTIQLSFMIYSNAFQIMLPHSNTTSFK